MGSEETTLDQILARLARTTHGVVTRQEMNRAGLSNRAIQTRVRRGSLIRLHRGVYRVGHSAPSIQAVFIAAVRACGPEALLCGRAAAYLHGLLRGTVPEPRVLVPARRRVNTVATTETRRIDAADATTVKGIPVTTIARTLVDLAAASDDQALGRACHEALVRDRATPRKVEAVLSRRPTSRGAARVRRLLHGDEPVVLSRLETRFLKLLRDANLPLPQTNRQAGGHWVDCRWPDQRLTVELDGYRFHSSRHAWEKDRERERAARRRGDDHRRYTWGDVVERPEATVAELRALLAPR